jgi:phosphoglycerate dehydrogenase-like enzyme
VLGYGAIGQAIGRALEGLAVEVFAVSRSRPRGWRHQLGSFDWIVLALPGTPETKGTIGAAEIAAIEPEAVAVTNFRPRRLRRQDALTEALRERASPRRCSTWTGPPNAAPAIRCGR